MKIGGRVVIKDEEDNLSSKIFCSDIALCFLPEEIFNNDQILYPLCGTKHKNNDSGENHFDFLLELIASELKIE